MNALRPLVERTTPRRLHVDALGVAEQGGLNGGKDKY